MKKIFILIAGALMLTSCYKKIVVDYTPYYYDASDSDFREEVSVMSFNLRYPWSSDTGIKAWEFRKPGMIQMLREIHPECCGTQESDESTYKILAELDAALDEYAVVYGTYAGDVSSSNKGEYAAILYLKDSLSVVPGSVKTYWLKPGSINTPKVKVDGCSKYRIATCVTFERKRTGTRFVHVNTHLENGSGMNADIIRADQVKALTEVLDDYNTEALPWAMTADYNAEETDPIFDVLYAGPYNAKSARAQAHRSDNKLSFNNFGGSSDATWDHVFYNGFPTAKQFTTVTRKWGSVVYLSDHYPVYAIMKFDK